MISWYVDDKKVLHTDEEVNKKLIDTIAKHFGEITVSRGKNHKFPERTYIYEPMETYHFL